MANKNGDEFPDGDDLIKADYSEIEGLVWAQYLIHDEILCHTSVEPADKIGEVLKSLRESVASEFNIPIEYLTPLKPEVAAKEMKEEERDD